MRYAIMKCSDRGLIESMQKDCLPSDSIHQFEGCEWWVAWQGDTPVGFGGYKNSHVWRDTIYLCRAGVCRSHRGNGLQKRLISARLAHARKRGMLWAITDTRQNPASANSLISCGFKMYIPENPWGHKDACYWRRKI